ncbi:TolC family protein, partial [Persephonella sp.]
MIILIILIMMNACSSIHREMPDIVVPDKFSNAPSVEKAHKVILTYWWRDFNDQMLDSLISEALKNNRDIRLATEKVLEARATFGVSISDLFPSISLQADATRQKQSFRFSSAGSRVSIMNNTFKLTPVASYEVDLWGRLSSAKKAAKQRLLSSIENRKTIIHTVISDLASLYFERIGLQRRLEIAYSRLKNSKRTLRIVESRYRRGIASYLDLLQARAKVKEDESSIPQLI